MSNLELEQVVAAVQRHAEEPFYGGIALMGIDTPPAPLLCERCRLSVPATYNRADKRWELPLHSCQRCTRLECASCRCR